MGERKGGRERERDTHTHKETERETERVVLACLFALSFTGAKKNPELFE